MRISTISTVCIQTVGKIMSFSKNIYSNFHVGLKNNTAQLLDKKVLTVHRKKGKKFTNYFMPGLWLPFSD